MNRLIDHALGAFLEKTYGGDLARSVSEQMEAYRSRPDLSVVEFATAGLTLAALLLAKPTPDLVEDLGAWLARIEPIRRLLRFSGRDFRDFLLRLEELPGRAHLVLPRLHVPALVIDAQDRSVWLIMPDPDPTWRHLLMGLVRNMADDFGALCVISVEGTSIRIDICDDQFAEGRRFVLQEALLTGDLL